MNLKEVIGEFRKQRVIPDEFVESIEENGELRLELIGYFKENKDREFVISLLDKMVDFRRREDKVMTADSMMLGCYLVGLHNEVEDCIRVWNAKTTDFDTYCGVDVQLVPFAGLKETMSYLKGVKTEEGREALTYLQECKASGDFDVFENYQSRDEVPWFV